MSTATKTSKKTAKKAAKKSAPAKKATAKKVVTPAKKETKVEGKQQTMTVKDLIAAIKKGQSAFTAGGVRHNLAYLEKVADKAAERVVILK